MKFAGERAIECRYTQHSDTWIPWVIGGCAALGGIGTTLAVLLYILRSSIMQDIRTWELNRLKARCHVQHVLFTVVLLRVCLQAGSSRHKIVEVALINHQKGSGNTKVAL